MMSVGDVIYWKGVNGECRGTIIKVMEDGVYLVDTGRGTVIVLESSITMFE